MNKASRIFCVIVAGAEIAIAAAILVSEPQIAWNSGARERLRAALRAIGNDLASGRTNPADFIAHVGNHDNTHDLAGRHGIAVQWRQQSGYEDVLFYPVAVSSTIDLDARPGPRPQVVLVPVESLDLASLPTLFECRDCYEDNVKDCQRRAMKRAFFNRNMDDAATLMSDRSATFVRVSELFEGGE